MPVRRTITNWVLALAAIALAFIAQGYFTRDEVADALIVYALAVNLPCIVAQRFNRPRLQKWLGRLKEL